MIGPLLFSSQAYRAATSQLRLAFYKRGGRQGATPHWRPAAFATALNHGEAGAYFELATEKPIDDHPDGLERLQPILLRVRDRDERRCVPRHVDEHERGAFAREQESISSGASRV